MSVVAPILGIAGVRGHSGFNPGGLTIMAAKPFVGISRVQVVTLEGARLGVARVRHPTSGVQCLSFTNPDGRRVALVSRESVTDLRQRLWQLSAADGVSYTLGPVDIAVVRNLSV
jgi:hypothetical protein